MALGTNRDYKTADRRGRTQLAKHAEIMNWLMEEKNLSRDEASAAALRAMEEGFDLELLKAMNIDRSGWLPTA